MFDHVVSPLLNCMIYHIFLINIPRGMNIVDIKKALTYVAHYSVVKERAFVSKELAKQLRAGHIDIFPWEDFHHLQGLWISHLAAMTQTGRDTRFIYNFLERP